MTAPGISSPMPAPTTPHVSEQDKIRSIPWSIASTALIGIFCVWTFGGSVFLLFLDRLGLPKHQIGWMLSLFPLSQVLGLWVAPWVSTVGRKRIFITFYAGRSIVMAGLLLVPLLLAIMGRPVALGFVYVVILTFALFRAMAETAYYPWFQEFVPDRLRGIYNAITYTILPVITCGALITASRVLDHFTGLTGFMMLIGAGSLIGLGGVLLMVKVPGGSPLPREPRQTGHRAEMRGALGNGNFRAYLIAFGLVTIGLGATTSFLPLFFKDRIGLSPSVVVMMDMATLVGAMLSSYPLGWMADRFGSRPVLMPSLMIGCALPPLLILLPHLHAAGVSLIAVLCAVNGAVTSGFTISASRLLFNAVIPADRSTAYTALYYAWMGITGGAAPLLAGWLLSCGGGNGLPGGYTLVFLLGLTCITAGMFYFRCVRPDSPMNTRHLIHHLSAALWKRLYL